MKATLQIITAYVSLLGLGIILPARTSEAPSPDESRFLGNIRQLTFEGRRSGEGYFSSDGKSLVFQSERESGNPFYQIYKLDLENGDCQRVSPGMGKTTCAFFRPQSDEIIFSSTHLDPDTSLKQKAELDFRATGKERRYSWDYDDHFDVFAARRDGGRLRRLSDAFGYDAEASCSPDGRKIVFTSLRDAYPVEKLSSEDRKRLETDSAYFGEIYIMNADGSGQRRLTFTPGYDGGPFFSPDGRRILWRRFETNGVNADIYTMKTDGSDVKRITDFGCMSWAPFYHPSGKYIIFTANKLGFSNFELFIADGSGESDPVRVTFTDGFDGLPSFSPDGRKLCWTSNRTGDGKSQLFLADWDPKAALAAVNASPRRGVSSSAVLASGRRDSPRVQADKRATDARFGGYSPDIRVEDLQHEVGYLASDALEGRLTGTPGAGMAADFIADQLRRAGLTLVGGNGNYFQTFEFSSGVKVVTNENRIIILTGSAEPSRALPWKRTFAHCHSPPMASLKVKWSLSVTDCLRRAKRARPTIPTPVWTSRTRSSWPSVTCLKISSRLEGRN